MEVAARGFLVSSLTCSQSCYYFISFAWIYDSTKNPKEAAISVSGNLREMLIREFSSEQSKEER